MKQLIFWLLIFLSCIVYANVVLFTERQDFALVLGQVVVLFVLMAASYYTYISERNVLNFSIIQWSAILFRLAVFFAVPNLSDDFYRFLWDGNLTVAGISPFRFLPENLISELDNEVLLTLYDGLNSKPYFSVYPPLNQYLFSSSAFLYPSSIFYQVMTLKFFILAAEIGTIIYLPRLLKALNLNTSYSVLYLLNPLVIIEGVGNIHFECMAVFFLLLSFYHLHRSRFILAAVFFALSVNVKLIPLILIPMIFKYLGLRKGMKFVLIVFLISLVFFIPFLDLELLLNIFSSIELYFQSFEFNASIYYIIRALGFWIKGYNIIHSAGVVLSVIMLISILILTKIFRSHQLTDYFSLATLSFIIYYLLSTTVHPWYLINLVFLSVFTPLWRSVFAWSFLVFLSYSAYANETYSENLYLLLIEYLLFLTVLSFDIRRMIYPRQSEIGN